MLTINPISSALIPVDSAAAQRVIAPNYDEFQSDDEIRALLKAQPESILRITMAHCCVPEGAPVLGEGSDESLSLAKKNLDLYRSSPTAKVVPNAMFIYEIEDVRRPGLRQIGLLGAAATGEIRTAQNPHGTIVRNEGIREAKAKVRADLIEATNCFTEIVNDAVEDPTGEFAALLERTADSLEPAFVAFDERRNKHTMWLIGDGPTQKKLQDALNARGVAYVADGNHRSAAAAMLGKPSFLSVFFTTERMGIFPYNRLIEAPQMSPGELMAKLSPHFSCRVTSDPKDFAPQQIHSFAAYTAKTWLHCEARPELYLGKSAAEQIDAAIIQEHVIDAIFGIRDAKDERITYVGGNKDAAYLQRQVDAGDYQFALSLAPVEMDQFVAVCRENSFMPPKSTWFEPKVRSGLVMGLL